ncbi:hypothetical protein INT47_010755 [Mucor saturninus]|uniref:Uncharacterized protein n=1 Tax=Mucor saturninus TaxID=64648 RepID=A0A8H7R0P2_9FUNG|nr:hypothetical protein INT47_010755 [Mucor saturninus]
MLLTSDSVNTAVDDILIGVKNLYVSFKITLSAYVLESPDSGKQLSWYDVKVNNTVRRPDFVGTILNNVVRNGPMPVGKITGENVKDDMHTSLLDLIRIGWFLKQSIDINHFKGIIVLTVIVYFICLLDYGLYPMIEICIINMPRDATQLRQYATVCENLLPVHHLCRQHCQLSGDVHALKANIRQNFKSLPSPSDQEYKLSNFIGVA